MSEDKAIIEKIYQSSDSGILDFFTSANASLVRRKLDRYGILSEGISLHIPDNAVRSPKISGARLLDISFNRRVSKDIMRNPFKSKLKAKFGLKKSL
jgi:hypothetical protein